MQFLLAQMFGLLFVYWRHILNYYIGNSVFQGTDVLSYVDESCSNDAISQYKEKHLLFVYMLLFIPCQTQQHIKIESSSDDEQRVK